MPLLPTFAKALPRTSAAGNSGRRRHGPGANRNEPPDAWRGHFLAPRASSVSAISLWPFISAQ